jgi:DNA-binding transcriptional regulator YiaG
MITKKSGAKRFLENAAGGPLTLGRLIAAIRQGEEMTQGEFAKMLDVTVSHVCDIETARKFVSPARAARFAKILRRSPAQFVRLALQDEVNEAKLKFHVEVRAMG